MNIKFNTFFSNLSYNLLTNFNSFIISLLVIIVIPKLIGIEEYGYWQLYIFYSSYVGFLQFGWTDGIYLRYGGERYEDLDLNLFFSQFWMLTISQLVISIIIYFLSQNSILNSEQQYILLMISICLVLAGVRAFILFILQATNRFKDFAKITIIDRLLYAFFIVFLLIFGIIDFKLMIVADLFGKLISLLFAIYICKDIVFQKISQFYFDFSEMFKNINIGIKLMFANIASMLIVGIVRFGIERTWDVATFGKISLTLSISNMMLIFINALGIIMFPILRRINQDKLSNIYIIMRDLLMASLFGILFLYFPLTLILKVWLPKYIDSLKYMTLIFPVFVYEGKMSLLINTYLKTLRFEKIMLKINVLFMIVSLFLTFIASQLFKNLNFTIINILILVFSRAIVTEIILLKHLKIEIKKDILLELILAIIFSISGWIFNSGIHLLLFGISYVFYLIFKRKNLIQSFIRIMELIKT